MTRYSEKYTPTHILALKNYFTGPGRRSRIAAFASRATITSAISGVSIFGVYLLFLGAVALAYGVGQPEIRDALQNTDATTVEAKIKSYLVVAAMWSVLNGILIGLLLEFGRLFDRFKSKTITSSSQTIPSP